MQPNQPQPLPMQNLQPMNGIPQPPIDQSIINQPVTGQPVAGQPIVSQPVTGQPVAGQPTTIPQQQAPNSDTIQKENPTSTQASLIISELRDSMVIMKDGSFRAVVACKSINFDLMSETEREAVEYSYQNFLNSLNFTIQILVRSQRVDIGPYLDRLTELRRDNDNMLLGILMDDYIGFIDELSQEANIMDKSFFIVIPYYTSSEAEKAVTQTKNFFKSFSRAKGQTITRIDRATYDKAVTEINNRVEAVIAGLFQIGIHSVRLSTKELGQLYYNFNNPDTAVREPLGDFNKLAHLYVKKGEPGTEGSQK